LYQTRLRHKYHTYKQTFFYDPVMCDHQADVVFAFSRS
jgi:hypothetical protein